MSDRTTEEKISAFRSKYAERVLKLQALLAPPLGIHARTKLSPEAIEETLRPLVDAVIVASWGLQDD